MCGGVFVGLGVIVTIVTFLACVAALFSPCWTNTNTLADISIGGVYTPECTGIFLKCSDFPNGECNWMNIQGGNKEEDWFMAVQWLWVIACVLMLAVAFACIALRFESCRAKVCLSILTSGSLTAFIAALCAIIVFGYNNKNLFDREASLFYDWGYYVSILATGGCLVTFCVFSCAIRCIRSAEL